jgi:16S rRNA (cytidine1402-2'-O)-methyltransferase
LVLFETGPRLADVLADLAPRLGARQAAVCREHTKLQEEIRTGDLDTLAQHYQDDAAPRGEIVIVIAPPDPDAQRATDHDVDALLQAALTRTSVKEAVSEVASATGHPRRAVYQRALAMTKDRDDAAQ